MHPVPSPSAPRQADAGWAGGGDADKEGTQGRGLEAIGEHGGC